MKNHILVVDDEADILELLTLTIERMGHTVASASDVKSAKAQLESHTFQACLTDLRLPDGTGLDLLAHIQTTHPDLPVAVITAHGDIDTAITALKRGAFDFVAKPVQLDTLRRLITTALQLSVQTAGSGNLLIGESATMQQLKTMIRKVGRSQAPVHITGASGTGKELVARSIHLQGARNTAHFVPVNCGAIPSELMESEFFGHIKGSFSGAVRDKDGLLQTADGGTLFLDEIADLPLHMQVKLLRVIQEKKVRPIGATKEMPIDIRILSATHKNLAEEVKAGRFREDLYYRVNVIELHTPSLRERLDDLPLLINNILQRLARSFGETAPTFSEHALNSLKRYAFPGNVRELENILERAMTLCTNQEIDANDLQLSPEITPAAAIRAQQTLPEGLDLESYLEQIERQLITTALIESGNNKTAAAKELGISFRALRYKLQKLDMD